MFLFSTFYMVKTWVTGGGVKGTSLHQALDEQRLMLGVMELTSRDRELCAVVDRYGAPPLWGRKPGFPTLVKIILEQQVSLASAEATYLKLLRIAEPLAPDTFLALSDGALRQAGFSRQKTRYCRILAESIRSGVLDLVALESMNEDEATGRLTSLKGVGPWTASIYLLMALGRQDVWPRGDLALLKAMRDLKGLSDVPGDGAAAEIAEGWRPWRAVAARILWHFYLSERDRV